MDESHAPNKILALAKFYGQIQSSYQWSGRTLQLKLINRRTAGNKHPRSKVAMVRAKDGDKGVEGSPLSN